MHTLPANTPWLIGQGLRTLSHYATNLRTQLAHAVERTHEELTRLTAQLPDAALVENATAHPEPFRYLDLTPFLPAQPSALRPAFVRSVSFTGFALLTVTHGIVVREDPGQYRARLLAHLDRLDGDALFEALKPWLPLPETPTAHGGAQCPEP